MERTIKQQFSWEVARSCKRWGVTRELKIEDTPIINGHMIYCNFIHAHTSLDGKTPTKEV